MNPRDIVYYNTRVGDLIVTMKTDGEFIISYAPKGGDAGGIRITAREFAHLSELFKDRKRR